MKQSNEVFDFQNSRKNPLFIPISLFNGLTLYTKQEIDEDLGNLLSADPDFFPLTQQKTLQATQSTPNTPTQVLNTLYLKVNDHSTPPPNLHQSLPAHFTTYDKSILPRRTTILFSNTSAGLPLAQMLPQRKLQSHQPQVNFFKPPFPPKTTTVKPSTVRIQSNLTSIPII